MAKLISAALRRLRVPLHTPYRLSYRTFEDFEPYLVVLTDDDGRVGFSDGHISPGSSAETREGGWNFCCRQLARIVGLDANEAKAAVLADVEESKVAATAVVSAIEVLQKHPLLEVQEDCAMPLLAPTSATEPDAIAAEVESRLQEGYTCLKIKVGKDVDADLTRVRNYQRAFAGRGTLRLDANRAFSEGDGKRFAAALDPEGIELFEQPCAAEDWDANAAVAAVSTVPLMLDEPICAPADIERAGQIPGVGYCKLKLKRFGSIEKLADSLALVRSLGMEPVLGDGLGSDVHAWLEACVARLHIRNAGEFNGFLKCYDRLLSDPPRFENGRMWLRADMRPSLNMTTVERLTVDRADFGKR